MPPAHLEQLPLDIDHLKVHGLPRDAFLPPLHPTQDRYHPDPHHATSAAQLKHLLKDGITLFSLQNPLSAQRIVIRVIEDEAPWPYGHGISSFFGGAKSRRSRR